MLKQKWSKEEELLIIKNYSSLGAISIAETLDRSVISVKHKASRLGVQVSNELRSSYSSANAKKQNRLKRVKISHKNFENISTPEQSYVLGFLWGDGYITRNIKNKICHVATDIVRLDGDILLPIFMKTGNWSVSYRSRKNRQPQMSIYACNSFIYNFFFDYEYNNKSLISPNKILSIIPEELKHYFFRGYFDADGCIYINIKNSCHQISICSTYEQDWSFMEHLFKKLNIKYSIVRRLHKKSKSSIVRISNKKDCLIFLDYIYQNYNNIGLSRKYNLYTMMHHI